MKKAKSKSKPKFPNDKKLEEVRDRLSGDDAAGSTVLDKNASQVDKIKVKACELIIKYRQRTDMKQKELASKLGIDEARMSEILHYKVDLFTLDRLLGYAEQLYPNLTLELAS